MTKNQISTLNLLLTERIINIRIEGKIKSMINKNELSNYSKMLLAKKQEIIRLKNISNNLNIEFNTEEYIAIIDLININKVIAQIKSKLPFDKKRSKYIFSLAKENFPKILLQDLIKSTQVEFDLKLKDIPYAVLVRCNIKRNKEYYDETKNSINVINTPMGGRVK